MKEKNILQFNLNGEFIKEWESAMNIEKELGFSRSGICNCAKGKLKTSNKFIWKYGN
jgi:hypothetical protein